MINLAPLTDIHFGHYSHSSEKVRGWRVKSRRTTKVPRDTQLLRRPHQRQMDFNESCRRSPFLGLGNIHQPYTTSDLWPPLCPKDLYGLSANGRRSFQLFVVKFDTHLVCELLLLTSNAQTAPNLPSLRAPDGDTSKELISAL